MTDHLVIVQFREGIMDGKTLRSDSTNAVERTQVGSVAHADIGFHVEIEVADLCYHYFLISRAEDPAAEAVVLTFVCAVPNLHEPN